MNNSPRDIFPKDIAAKRKLKIGIFSGEDLKLYLLFKFGTYEAAARAAQFTAERIFQISGGLDVPISPDVIKRLSSAWDIDVVVLTSLFERLRGDNSQ